MLFCKKKSLYIIVEVRFQFSFFGLINDAYCAICIYGNICFSSQLFA